MHASLQTRPESNKSEAAARFSVHESGARPGLPFFLQTKLNVNQPGDAFEQEADHVASAVSNGSGHSCPTCGGAGGGGSCPTCQGKQEDKNQKKVQLKRLPGAGAANPAGPALDTYGGDVLSPNVRRRVEPVLGYDLSGVRVHTDSRARESASALQAKAFTHQNHIWLGSHQSSEDVNLMAHEATHVVQQGASRTPSHFIQRRETTNDGEAPKARLLAKIEEETGTQVVAAKPGQPAAPQPDAAGGAPAAPPQAPPPPPAAKPQLSKEQQEAKSKIDPGEKQAKKGEAEGSAHPDIDRPAAAQPKAEAGARETKQKVDEPPKPIAGESEAAGKKKDPGKDKGGKKGAAPAAPGDTAFAAADAVPRPDAAPPVAVPPPVMPIDAAGKPLPPNPASDAKVASIAAEAQVLRDEGLRLRQAAAEMRGNAHALRGNLQMVQSGVGNSEATTAAFHDNSKYRHDAAAQADTGLGISDQKATTVAEQAPGGVDKANEQKAKSGEVAGESSSLAGESAGQTGDDEEAAAKAKENSGAMDKVSSDIGTIDNAVGQAQSAATTLVKDAAEAKTTNAATHVKLDEVKTTLGQTDDKLKEMDGQNAGARSQLAALSSGPDQLLAQAQALDDQGAQLIETSKQIETNLAASQANYAQSMKSIPKEVEEPAQPEGDVQRAPEDGAASPEGGDAGEGGKPEEKSKDIDLTESLPEWLTGEQKPSDVERERAFKENEDRRKAEIEEIENSKKGGFDQLTQGDKALMALQLTGRNLFGGVSKISWPGWGKVGEGAAKMIIGIFDPRSALTGALSGVNMIVNASVQFFKQPSWGGLLKLAADIATGITIILGSIVALAGTIAAIMTALSILSFGTLAPICGPVIAFCATVMSTVGGWTFWAGMVALGLQALVFLKDLYAASTAKTAAELQKSSEAMSADAKNAGNAALQAGMGKLAQFGGRAMQQEIKAAGGGVNFAKNIASKSLLGEAGQGFKGGGGIKGFGKALGKGIGKRAVGAGKSIKQAVTHPIQTIKDIRSEMKAAGEKKPIGFQEGTSKEFLVGSSKESAVAANEAKAVGGAGKVGEEVHAPSQTAPSVEEPKALPPSENQPAGAGGPKGSEKEPVALKDQEPGSPGANDARTKASQNVENAKLAPQDAQAQLEHLADNPHLMEGEPGSRRAKIGDHEWVEQPNGNWCRHSDGELCVVLPKNLRDALAEVPKVNPKDPVKSGEVVEYQEGTIADRGVKDDKLTPDHIPSRAALVKKAQEARYAAKAQELGHDLSDAEKKMFQLTDVEKDRIRDKGLSIMDDEAFHKEYSRTYGSGRNTPAQIAEDAKDLGVASVKDFDAKLAGHQAHGSLTRARVVAYIDLYERSVTAGVYGYSNEMHDLLERYLLLAK